MFERFTGSARRTVVLAQEQARLRHDRVIGTEHLLLGVVRVDGPAQAALTAVGVAPGQLDAAVAAPGTATGTEPGSGPAPGGADRAPTGDTPPVEVGGHIAFSSHCKKALELALREALSMGHPAVDGGHILLGVLRVPHSGGVQALGRLGVDVELLRRLTVD
ncbi:MAG TPA: Clp protease N-terminal domain-containing protein, partial [Acidimicrobiales bacterium]